MLDVWSNLVAVAVMLFSIMWPGHHIEVDSLNSPTVKPIPDGSLQVWRRGNRFKNRTTKIWGLIWLT